MALDIVVLIDGSDESRMQFSRMKATYPHIKKIVTRERGLAAFKVASRIANTACFFLVDHNIRVTKSIFDFVPSEFDQQYSHVWQFHNTFKQVENGGVYLLNKKALRANVETLEQIGSGIKYMEQVIAETPPHDIIFLSYDEPDAGAYWSKLLFRFPNLPMTRVHGVKGILNAHIEAAKHSATENFFVVDGDSEIVEDFDFHCPLYEGEKNFVHVWKARNPVNGLEYGYGGVKLFHKSMFQGDLDFVDMSTLLGDGVKLVDRVASITRFNSDRFHAFRGAFRECAKLASGVIKNHNDEESWDRLYTWQHTAEGDFAEDVLAGAKAGTSYGLEHVVDGDLKRINDFEWLKQLWTEQYE